MGCAYLVDGAHTDHCKATSDNLCSIMLIIELNMQYDTKVQNRMVSHRQAQLVLRPALRMGAGGPHAERNLPFRRVWAELPVMSSPSAQYNLLPSRTHIQPLLHLRIKCVFAIKLLLLFFNQESRD